jgi:hypothetical protein
MFPSRVSVPCQLILSPRLWMRGSEGHPPSPPCRIQTAVGQDSRPATCTRRRSIRLAASDWGHPISVSLCCPHGIPNKSIFLPRCADPGLPGRERTNRRPPRQWQMPSALWAQSSAEWAASRKPQRMKPAALIPNCPISHPVSASGCRSN